MLLSHGFILKRVVGYKFGYKFSERCKNGFCFFTGI